MPIGQDSYFGSSSMPFFDRLMGRMGGRSRAKSMDSTEVLDNPMGGRPMGDTEVLDNPMGGRPMDGGAMSMKEEEDFFDRLMQSSVGGGGLF